MFKPSKLRAYLHRAQEAGLDPAAILDGSGVSWAEVEALRPLDLDTMAGLFDYLARRTPPGFAIRSGSDSKAADFGIVGFSMMSMKTMRAAFEHWNRYCLVAGHPLVTTITESGDEWCMHFESRRIMTVDALRFCIEASITATEAIIQELTRAPANTLRIDLPYPPTADPNPYGGLGTDNIRYNRPHAIYYGKRSDLDRAIPESDDEIRGMLDVQCAHLLAELTNSRPLAERLEDLMQVSVGTMPSLDEMAAKLGTSRRSLQRELSNAGLNYQLLVKQFRMRHAFSLLGENRSNIKTIAFILGFRDVGSFRRAFQDWTGQSIGEWQAARADTARCRAAKGSLTGREELVLQAS